MKKKLLLVFYSVVLVTVYGQVKIEPNGRVIVGPNALNNLDADNVLSMSIQGRWGGELNPGSKLAFGDFGSRQNQGWNVFIGEYGTTDSDIMWLHGKKGIRMTSGDGSFVLLELGCDATTRCFVPGGLLTTRLAVGSNDSFKTNVVPVTNALSRLLLLDSYSYRYTLTAEYSRRNDASNDTLSVSADVCATEKERQDSAWFARRDSLRSAGTSLYGFVTDSLERIFPELVETDAKGNKYVDYIGMIPLIVAALNEQQRTIDEISAKLQECCSNVTENDEHGGYGTEGSKGSGNGITGGEITPNEAILYQNKPNPFTVKTTIEFFLPSTVNSATLYVFSNGGALVKTYPLATRGVGSVTIDGSTLAAGMYIYTLVADGQIIDSKRMILTE